MKNMFLYNNITINNVPLYFGGDVPKEELLSYSFPPTPPGNIKDVRYNDNMRYSKDGGTIKVQGGENILVEYNIQSDEEWELSTDNECYQLKGREKIEIKRQLATLNLKRTENEKINK